MNEEAEHENVHSDKVVPRVLDIRLPLTWLASGFAATLIGVATLTWNVSVQNSKLETLVGQFSKLDGRLDQGQEADKEIHKELYDLKLRMLQHEYQFDAIKNSQVFGGNKNGGK